MTSTLTWFELAEFDDFLTASVVDPIYYWATIRKAYHQTNFKADKTLSTKEALALIRNHLVFPTGEEATLATAKRLNFLMEDFMKMGKVRNFLRRYPEESKIREFNRHAKRYFQLFQKDCGFDVCTTDRYLSKSGNLEACVIAKRVYEPNEEIKYLFGCLAQLDEEEINNFDQNDFSIINISSKNTPCLMLGPTRFVNHDCNGNAKFWSNKSGMTIVSVRRILVGEEITVTYAANYFGKKNKDCLCATCERDGLGGFAPKQDNAEQPQIVEDGSADENDKKVIEDVLSDEENKEDQKNRFSTPESDMADGTMYELVSSGSDSEGELLSDDESDIECIDDPTGVSDLLQVPISSSTADSDGQKEGSRTGDLGSSTKSNGGNFSSIVNRGGDTSKEKSSAPPESATYDAGEKSKGKKGSVYGGRLRPRNKVNKKKKVLQTIDLFRIDDSPDSFKTNLQTSKDSYASNFSEFSQRKIFKTFQRLYNKRYYDAKFQLEHDIYDCQNCGCYFEYDPSTFEAMNYEIHPSMHAANGDANKSSINNLYCPKCLRHFKIFKLAWPLTKVDLTISNRMESIRQFLTFWPAKRKPVDLIPELNKHRKLDGDGNLEVEDKVKVDELDPPLSNGDKNAGKVSYRYYKGKLVEISGENNVKDPERLKLGSVTSVLSDIKDLKLTLKTNSPNSGTNLKSDIPLKVHRLRESYIKKLNEEWIVLFQAYEAFVKEQIAELIEKNPHILKTSFFKNSKQVSAGSWRSSMTPVFKNSSRSGSNLALRTQEKGPKLKPRSLPSTSTKATRRKASVADIANHIKSRATRQREKTNTTSKRGKYVSDSDDALQDVALGDHGTTEISSRLRDNSRRPVKGDQLSYFKKPRLDKSNSTSSALKTAKNQKVSMRDLILKYKKNGVEENQVKYYRSKSERISQSSQSSSERTKAKQPTLKLFAPKETKQPNAVKSLASNLGSSYYEKYQSKPKPKPNMPMSAPMPTVRSGPILDPRKRRRPIAQEPRTVGEPEKKTRSLPRDYKKITSETSRPKSNSDKSLVKKTNNNGLFVEDGIAGDSDELEIVEYGTSASVAADGYESSSDENGKYNVSMKKIDDLQIAGKAFEYFEID